MRLVLTLVATGFDALQDALPAAAEAIAAAGRPIDHTEVLGEGAADLFVEGADLAVLRACADRGLERAALDFCVQTAEGRRKRLLVADMDSTIIGVECLDELADFAGLREEIAAVTARAMAGEIAFEGALRDRVALLAGLELAALERTYDERVRLNPGAAPYRGGGRADPGAGGQTGGADRGGFGLGRQPGRDPGRRRRRQ